jgi:hypothetical protein
MTRHRRSPVWSGNLAAAPTVLLSGTHWVAGAAWPVQSS